MINLHFTAMQFGNIQFSKSKNDMSNLKLFSLIFLTCKVAFLPGSSDAMLLFFLGISIGVMSTSHSNRKEVEKLTDLLNHTENLVQDLQEELEMNNSLTVKELHDEASESVELNEDLGNVDKSISSFHSRLSCMQSPQENNANCAHNLRNIEAELEAELEKLELNMNGRGLDEVCFIFLLSMGKLMLYCLPKTCCNSFSR